MLEDKELDEIIAQREQSEQLNKEPQEAENIKNDEEVVLKESVSSENSLQEIPENNNQTPVVYENGYDVAVDDTKRKIIDKAKEKINEDKMIDKHSQNLAKIADRALEVDAETQALQVEAKNTDNKVKKQEIKNRLIVLRAEAERSKREQKQISKEQKAEHKKRNADALWALYSEKLTKMKYTYVPNIFVLKMLLFFDGIASFFNGLGTVSTAIVKASKWIGITLGIIIILMIIPITREWLLTLLKFK